MALPVPSSGFRRVTITGSGTITLATVFPGVTFASTDEYCAFVESGRAVIGSPSDMTTTTILITNNLSPTTDSTVIIMPLRSA